MTPTPLLAINCGSATVKARLFQGGSEGLRAGASFREDAGGRHREAIARILAALGATPRAVVHRVVHGGTRFREAARIDEAAETEIRRLSALAPLHNAPALLGIDATRGLGVPMVAVFDTAFHATLPETASRYALPRGLPPEIRRFGFHGLSHRSVMEQYAAATGSLAPTLVTLHLGGGCSAAALRHGRSVDTSMGMTPLEGLVMGTRSGDVDPGIVLHLLREGRDPDEVEEMLARESGLLGLAGTADMREILSRQDGAARLALDIFCMRARKCVGAYLALLEDAEAVVVTGGIGENAPEVRRRILSGLHFAGLTLDDDSNERGEGRISTDDSRLHAFVFPSDEESIMAREALAVLQETA